MKIFCIGRNYAEHAAEMKAALPTEPVFFLKPDTALLRNNEPFYYPYFSKNIHHEVELIIKISKHGKNIAKNFAHKYYEEIGIGIDFTARDIQDKLKEKSLPWEKSKAFDGSAVVGSFVNKNDFGTISNINFHLTINNQITQQGNTNNLLFSFDDVIAYLSTFITLKTGDLIFTGTPHGVGPVNIGDNLKAYIENKELLSFEIK